MRPLSSPSIAPPPRDARSPSPSPSATGRNASADDQRLRQAAQAFEAVFLRQMIGSMRQARLGEDLLGSSAGEQFRDLADARLADSMAERGGFGIAEMLLNQFRSGNNR